MSHPCTAHGTEIRTLRRYPREMSRRRVGPFAILRDMFANHSDLGVIVAFFGVGLVAVLGYAIVRGDGDSSAKVTVDRSTTSTPRFTAPPPTRATRRTTPTVLGPAPSATTTAAPNTTTTTRRSTRRATGRGTTGRGTASRGTKTGGEKVFGPATSVRWTASPATATLGAGAHLAGSVVAKNLNPSAGWVLSPGCSSGPTMLAVASFDKRCAPAGRKVVLPGSRSHRWEWTWNATSDGKITGAPLAAGNYSFKIGGATVTVTVI